MSFVPVITPPPAPPSPRAQELGYRLSALIEQFQREHPEMSAIEVRQALQLASTRQGVSSAAMIAAVLLGLVAAAGLAALLFLR